LGEILTHPHVDHAHQVHVASQPDDRNGILFHLLGQSRQTLRLRELVWRCFHESGVARLRMLAIALQRQHTR
jgi:hypothetical protein